MKPNIKTIPYATRVFETERSHLLSVNKRYGFWVPKRNVKALKEYFVDVTSDFIPDYVDLWRNSNEK